MDESWADTFAPTGGGDEHALVDGSRVAVIGGGPAGSFFSYFLLDLAERAGIDISVDIYEPRDFSRPGPAGCNMCGGIISESLVQNLATDGINLQADVVQRGIESYVLHMDVGTVRIATPLHEKRIAAVHRGPGPKDLRHLRWKSFDGHLLSLAVEKGARTVPQKAREIDWADGRPRLAAGDGEAESYDLLAVAAGINSGAIKLLQSIGGGYEPPRSSKTLIREYYLGADRTNEYLGDAMHVFLLNIPRLEFAAIIPKGEYASVCLLGDDVDKKLMESFLNSPEVRGCMPPDWVPETTSCMCSPRISTRGAPRPYADRVVFIGDSGATRLYKDGIGAAYRTAKAAATTAVFRGVSAEDFKKHYGPVCKAIENDNTIGKGIFIFMRVIQKVRLARHAVLRMVSREQKKPAAEPRMSSVLWDMFTGSASYREVFSRTLHPGFWGRLLGDLALSVAGRRNGGGGDER